MTKLGNTTNPAYEGLGKLGSITGGFKKRSVEEASNNTMAQNGVMGLIFNLNGGKNVSFTKELLVNTAEEGHLNVGV